MRAERTEQKKKRPWSERRPPLGVTLLLLVSYIPLLLTKPGQVGADTKTYLYLDPGRLLSRAPFMWDPNIGLGTVTHQNIGYLWPMGPYYFLMDAVGIPDWVAQRLWMGSIIFAAGLGVRWMLRELRWEGKGLTVAAFAYALSPYILDYAARISVILLPFAGLPWLIGLSVRCLRRKDWKTPAIFALVTLTVGGVNATSLVLVMVGPLTWFIYATFVLREVRFSDALKAGLKISLLTLITSLWWLAGLLLQGTYGIPILRYTETYRTVADAALATELLRGLGYWFFYGQDGLGAWTASSITFVQTKIFLVLSFLLPGLGFIGALVTRWRTRLYFAVLLVAGLIIGVGAHPWENPSPYGAMFKAWSRSDLGLSFRSTPRAVPLIALGLSVFLGAGVAALSQWRPRLYRPVAAALLVLICLNQLPLFRGQLVDRNLMRDEKIPSYWNQAARALNDEDSETRVLEIPGIDFAAYRWGNTVDPITPGITDREYAARELIPYGTPPSANLLNALDAPFQAGRADPSVLAPLARLMGVGDILFRADLQYERYLTPRPPETWAQLLKAPGLGQPERFGRPERNEASPELPVDDPRNYGIPFSSADPPPVSIFPVLESRPIARTISANSPILVSGDGDGLVSLASAGQVDPTRAVLYSASFAGDPERLDSIVETKGSSLVVTDTNRRQARRWGSVRENSGYTERAGEKSLVTDPTDNRLDLFPNAGDDAMTVSEQVGGATVAASGYGNAVTYTPGDRAVNAMDDDEGSAWRVAAFGKAKGEFLDVSLPEEVSADHIELLQGQGFKNRWMTEVSLQFDSSDPVRVQLDETSRSSPGQTISFAERKFKHLRVTVEATDIGPQPSYRGVSDVGIAELRIPGVGPVQEIVRPPVDMLERIGAKSIGHDLSYIFSRRATHQRDTLASDEEPSMLRKLVSPVARSFAPFGKGRLSVDRTDEQIDETLDLASAEEGGVTATSSARMPGTIASRARSAVDGNPLTAYMTPVNDPLQTISFTYPEQVEIDSLELTTMIGNKYSVPSRIGVEVDDHHAGSFEASFSRPSPAVAADQISKLSFDTGTLTGRTFTISIEEVDERHSKDWFSGARTVLPVAINKVNLPSVRPPAPGDAFDSGCRNDMVSVDGTVVPVRMTGSYGAATSGDIVRLESCGGAVPVEAGENEVATVPGATTGLDIDLLALSSAKGGGPGPDTLSEEEVARQAEASQIGPSSSRRRTGRLSYSIDVSDARDPYWVILGQSLSEGWTATTSTGTNLGSPTLVNGFANGWQIDPAIHGETITIELRWTPQRLVWVGLALSAIGLLVCLGLALWPRRRPNDPHPPSTHSSKAKNEPGTKPLVPMPTPLREVQPRPSVRLIGTVSLATLVCAAFFGGPYVGLATALGVALALSVSWGRWAIRAASILLFGASAGVVVMKQVLRSYPIDFKWVEHFELTHAWALAATFLLVGSVAVDALLGKAAGSGLSGSALSRLRSAPESKGQSTGS